MASLFSKVWSAGERLLASDLNANFNETFKQSLTASGAININDIVNVVGASQVKRMSFSAQETGAGVSTSPGHTNSAKFMELSTAGLYLHFSGGDRDNAAVLYAQVRTMNAGETDFSNGSEATIYSTGNGVNWFDVCKIGTDKFLVIYQTNTAGAGAGIKAVVLTISGTTITVGSSATIETTGQINAWVSCCKLDTDKALITYRKDSDGFLYCQVLTVSGTTITTNTAVAVKSTSSTHRCVVRQFDTNSAVVVYNLSSGNLYGKVITVSGTTPTVNSEQTLDTGATNYMIGMEGISTTKMLLCFGDDGGGAFNDRAAHIAISGSTLTKSSNINLASARQTWYYGIFVIGDKALVGDHASNTSYEVRLLDVSGTAPTQTSSQTLSCNDISGLYDSVAITRVSPFIYVCGVSNAVGDYIIKLTQHTGAIGLAEAAIADTASGNIMMRYHVHTLASFTLVPGTIYYNGDDGQLTTKSSSRTTQLGVAISTTKLLIT